MAPILPKSSALKPYCLTSSKVACFKYSFSFSVMVLFTKPIVFLPLILNLIMSSSPSNAPEKMKSILQEEMYRR